ncbi:MAG: glycosyltransferase family 2 protein [Neisseria sp.]|nr:glycosyltransferase family 2 protein [Neisseria sp.]
MQPDVSLIITTYNRPDALSLVLQSALTQSILPKQIIVADDGSRQETADLVADFAAASPVPLIHSWRSDDGFRAAEARNRALAQAVCSYIVLVDGDMILHPEFIRDHLAIARPGFWVQGSRVLLTPQATGKLLSHPLPPNYAPSPFSDGIIKKHAAWRCPLLYSLIARFSNQSSKAVKSCNMGFYRADAEKANGFNNEFVGWGREDSEFTARLYHNGIRRRNLKFGGLAYHLWHHEAERSSLARNDELLRQTLSQKLTRCENGLDAFSSERPPSV